MSGCVLPEHLPFLPGFLIQSLPKGNTCPETCALQHSRTVTFKETLPNMGELIYLSLMMPWGVT